MGKGKQSCFGKEGTWGVPTGWVSGGSVCLAMHMLGEGVSTHGAGDCEPGEQQTGGGCERVSEAPHGSVGGPCWKSGGVILQAVCVCSAPVFQQGLPV